MSNTVKGLKLIGWQNTFARMFEGLQANDKLVVKASRQKGKSTCLCQALLYTALNHPKSESYWISPTNSQAAHQFDDLQKAIGGSPLVTKMNASTLEIRFHNKSSIFFKSAESGDNLRGNTVKNGGVLVIDEAAFVKDDVIAILLPYVTVSKAPVILISTPRKKRGAFYDWYQKALAENPGYKYIDVNQFDNSFFISEDQIEDYRKIMSQEKFKNEILGLFSDDNEGVFNDYQGVFATPEDCNPVYVGIDFSSTGTDFTVVSGFNAKGQQCLLWYDNRIKEPTDRLVKIAELLNGYPSIQKVLCEQNSIGAVYISLLKKHYKKPNIIESFNTTNTSKNEIIENLIAKIGKKEITLLPDDELDYQFSIFQSAVTSGGKTTYYADPKAQNSHDDIPMATAIALKGMTSTAGSYRVMSVNRYSNKRPALSEKYK